MLDLAPPVQALAGSQRQLQLAEKLPLLSCRPAMAVAWGQRPVQTTGLGTTTAPYTPNTVCSLGAKLSADHQS